MEKLEKTNLEDAELVLAALGGDKGSFGLLVRRYWAAAVALALAKCPDVDAAEDIAQESFISAYNKLAQLRRPERFAGWLCRIVHQKFIDHYRSVNRQKTKLLDISTAADVAFSQNSADPLVDAENREKLYSAISQMTDKYRTVIVLRFISGLDIIEIAEKLGKRTGTISVWLHRGINILRSELVEWRRELT